MLLKDRWAPRAEEKERGAELKAAPLSPPPPALTNNKRAITSPIKKRRLTKKRTCKRAHAFASRRPDQRGPLLETSGPRRFSLQRTSWGFHLSPSLTLCFHCYLLLFVGNLSLSFSSTSPLARPILAPNQPPFSTARPSLAFNHAEKAQPCAHWQSCIKQAGFFFVSVICR